MSGNTNIITPFTYFGGKATLALDIIDLFPKHLHYVEVFCGSSVVALNKAPSKIDTINDINGEVINFFQTLRDFPNELIYKLQNTPLSRQEFENSFFDNSLDDIENARRFFVRARQGINGMGAQQVHKGWGANKYSTKSLHNEKVTTWLNSIEKLELIRNILIQFQIENQTFEKVIEKYDFPEVFFYLDPPYMMEGRTGNGRYKYEFTLDLHQNLRNMLSTIKGKFMVSGYEGEIMDSLYKGFYKHKFKHRKNNMRKSESRECVWMNYDPHLEKGQLNIF